MRRYGFHGTSYSFVTKKLAEALGKRHRVDIASSTRVEARHSGKPVGSVNAILCHLGSGASMCVVENGKSMDTTMGLTPLEGLVMGTRAGDVDTRCGDQAVPVLPRRASSGDQEISSCTPTTLPRRASNGGQNHTTLQVDAGVLSFLARQGREASDVDALLNKKSGLLGLSNVGSDMRAVRSNASTRVEGPPY